jgi:hypothetical protein
MKALTNSLPTLPEAKVRIIPTATLLPPPLPPLHETTTAENKADNLFLMAMAMKSHQK